MKKAFALVLIILAGSLLFFLKENYRQKNSADTMVLNLSWTMSLSEIKDLNLPVTFDFTLTDEHQNKITDAEIELVANMSHPGMVPVNAVVEKSGQGTYKSSFHLTMPGDWILFLTIRLKSGMEIKKEVLFKTMQ